MRPEDFAQLFARDLTRLAQELRAFPDTDSIWKTAPGIVNPAGTLALHLEGNLREFVGRQIGAVAYTRDRPAEFNTRGVDRDELVSRAERLAIDIGDVLKKTSAETLESRYPQDLFGYPMSTAYALLHLLGHLNYHLGQIDYLRRVTTGSGAIALEGMPASGPAGPRP